MYIKEYLTHIFLLILMLILISFFLFILFYNSDIFQTIVFASIIILFFRDFYQMIIGSVFNLILFIFLPKKLSIKNQEDGRFMIIKKIKKINIFKFLNKYIDMFFDFLLKRFFNKTNKYEYLENVSNFIIIKRNLEKKEAEIELLKYQRIEKLRNII